MATINELQQEETTRGQSIADLVASEAQDSKDNTVVEKGKDIATDIAEEVLGTPEPSDTAVAGAAFAAALVDGYSFGGFRLIMGALGMGEELDELRRTHPNISTAGDIASFITPAIAVKLWVKGTQLGVRGLATALRTASGSATKATHKRFVKAFAKYSKGGTRPAGDISNFVADVLKISKPQAKSLVSKYKITGSSLNKDMMMAVFGLTPRFVSEADKLLPVIKAAAKTDTAIDKSLKTLKKLNLTLGDVVQVGMAYHHTYNFLKEQGKSDAEARSAAFAAALSLGIGKGLSTQVIDRILGNVLEKGARTGHQLFGLTRLIGEAALGLTIWNLGNLEGHIEGAVDTVGNTLIKGGETLTKNKGGLIAPSKRGTFKAQATKMGMSVQEAANKILAAPEGTYTPTMRKKANFAKNFAKNKGGLISY